MTEIAVLGAASPTGRQLLSRLAQDGGVALTALARRRPAEVPAGVRWLVGDATDPAVVAEAVDRAQVVITLVAAPVGTAPLRVRSQATKVLLEAISKATACEHLIAVSALGGSGSLRQLTRPARWVYRMSIGAERLAEVDRQEDLIASSGLAATVVRPPRLDDRPGSGYRVVSGGVGLSAVMHREDLARCLAGLATGVAPTGTRFMTVVSS